MRTAARRRSSRGSPRSGRRTRWNNRDGARARSWRSRRGTCWRLARGRGIISSARGSQRAWFGRGSTEGSWKRRRRSAAARCSRRSMGSIPRAAGSRSGRDSNGSRDRTTSCARWRGRFRMRRTSMGSWSGDRCSGRRTSTSANCGRWRPGWDCLTASPSRDSSPMRMSRGCWRQARWSCTPRWRRISG